MIKFEYLYGNVGHACFTAGKWFFDANMSKAYTQKTTSLNIIFVNDNEYYIKKSLARVCR